MPTRARRIGAKRNAKSADDEEQQNGMSAVAIVYIEVIRHDPKDCDRPQAVYANESVWICAPHRIARSTASLCLSMKQCRSVACRNSDFSHPSAGRHTDLEAGGLADHARQSSAW